MSKRSSVLSAYEDILNKEGFAKTELNDNIADYIVSTNDSSNLDDLLQYLKTGYTWYNKGDTYVGVISLNM